MRKRKAGVLLKRERKACFSSYTAVFCVKWQNVWYNMDKLMLDYLTDFGQYYNG